MKKSVSKLSDDKNFSIIIDLKNIFKEQKIKIKKEKINHGGNIKFGLNSCQYTFYSDTFEEKILRAIEGILIHEPDDDKIKFLQGIPKKLEIKVEYSNFHDSSEIRIEKISHFALVTLAYYLLRVIKVFECEVKSDMDQGYGLVAIDEAI
ncbi:MAG: hypothetical protein ABIN35_07000 [candidate division WOR-3 bacterium]